MKNIVILFDRNIEVCDCEKTFRFDDFDMAITEERFYNDYPTIGVLEMNKLTRLPDGLFAKKVKLYE